MAKDILVPNIGDFKNVEIIEILIKEGQEIKKGDAVITLESDKSSVEVPSSLSGKVEKIHIKIGDKVSEGSLVASLEESSSEKSKAQEIPSKSVTTNSDSEKSEPKELKSLIIPSIDFSGKLIVTDILVKEGDAVSIEQPIITLEDDNSSIDIPSPVAGIIYKILVKKKRRSVYATRNLQS